MRKNIVNGRKAMVKATDRVNSPVTFRPNKSISPDFFDVVKASKRSKASIIHECLEAKLPDLVRQYLPAKPAKKMT